MATTIFDKAVKGNIKGVGSFLFPKFYHFRKPAFLESTSKKFHDANSAIKKYLGYTTLMIAVQYNHSDLVQYLLDIGADKFNGKEGSFNDKGYNSLMISASTGNIEIAKILIEHFKLRKDLNNGYNVIKPTKEFLQQQEDYYESNKNEIDTLEKENHEGYVNLEDGLGNTALIYAAINNQNSMVEFLIENGADIFISNNDDLDAISYAVLHENLDLVKLLKERGADLHLESGKEPLLNSAVKSGNLSIFKYLLSENIDINNIYNGESPIILAVKNKYLTILKELINSKADLSVKDGEGNSLLDLAIKTEDNKIIKALKGVGIKPGAAKISKYNSVLNKVNPHERVNIDKIIPALKGIELNPTKESTSAIFNLINNCNSPYDTDEGRIRKNAFDVLSKIKDPRIAEKLKEILDDMYASEPVKIMSLKCLYNIAREKSVEYLIRFIGDNKLGPLSAELMLKLDEIPEEAISHLSMIMGEGEINSVDSYHHEKAALVLGKSKNKKSLKPLNHLLKYYNKADFYNESGKMQNLLKQQINIINKL